MEQKPPFVASTKSRAFSCLAAVALGCLLLPGFGLAQDQDYHHHNVEFSVGPGIPTGSTRDYLSTAPMIEFGYGYRFNRLLQAEAGLQIAFGAANNQNPEVTDVGLIQGGDREYMVPLGGRIYIPVPWSRISLSAGGGGAYLHYSETVSSGSPDYSIGCYSCTSRGGWGGYGLGNVSYYLDANHNFRIGTTAQFVAAHTNGDAVANIPALRTTDHWTNVLFGFGFSF